MQNMMPERLPASPPAPSVQNQLPVANSPVAYGPGSMPQAVESQAPFIGIGSAGATRKSAEDSGSGHLENSVSSVSGQMAHGAKGAGIESGGKSQQKGAGTKGGRGAGKDGAKGGGKAGKRGRPMNGEDEEHSLDDDSLLHDQRHRMGVVEQPSANTKHSTKADQKGGHPRAKSKASAGPSAYKKKRDESPGKDTGSQLEPEPGLSAYERKRRQQGATASGAGARSAADGQSAYARMKQQTLGGAGGGGGAPGRKPGGLGGGMSLLSKIRSDPAWASAAGSVSDEEIADLNDI